MRRSALAALAALTLLAGTTLAQNPRPARMNETGWAAMGAPSSATLGCVGVFLGSPLNLQCAPSSGIVYTTATKSLDVTDGRVQAANLKAIGLATPGGITVTPTLTQVGSITTVAGSALVDGDYFTVKYDGGTVPIEFDLSPGDGTTGGRIPLLFTVGDSADLIRDNVILTLNAAAPTKLTASSGGAATVALVLDTPGATGDTNTENVADAGFAVTGFADPTHATTVTYQLVACLADGSCTQAGADSTTGTATATLSAANFNRLSWSAVSGAASYKIRRDVGGATQGVIWSGTALTVDDTGLAGDGTAKPTADGTGVVTGARFDTPRLTLDSPLAATTGDTVLTLPSSDATKGGFHLVYNEAGVYEGARDPIIFFGYNVGPTGGGRVHTANNQGAMFLSIEGNWKTSGLEMTEFHVESIDASDVLHRMLSFASVNTTGATSAALNVGQLVIYNATDDTPMVTYQSGASPQTVFHDGALYLGTYGMNFQAINKTGGAYIPTIGLDPYDTLGTNRIAIGHTFLTATETAAYVSGMLDVWGQDAAHVPFSVHGKAAQTANLQEWTTSTPTTVAYVSPAGVVSGTGVRVLTGARPTCNAAARGTLWYVAGGAGVADTCEICRKDGADSYAWVTIF